MTIKFTSSATCVSAPARLTAAMALAMASILASGNHASAQGCPAVPVPTVAQNPATKELEQAYWACDHATTNQLYDRQTAMACSVIYENLKARRFNGDFCQMLAWRQQYKRTRHQALDATERQPQASRR